MQRLTRTERPRPFPVGSRDGAALTVLVVAVAVAVAVVMVVAVVLVVVSTGGVVNSVPVVAVVVRNWSSAVFKLCSMTRRQA